MPKKNDILKVAPAVTLQYRQPGYGWCHHSTHDSVRDATRVRAIICRDPAEKAAKAVWRIVEWTGTVASVLPAHQAG